MLDDLKMIAQRDKSDTLGVAEKQLNQLDYKFDLSIEKKAEIHNVVFAGMGGSALYADLAQSWPGINVPYQIVKSYNIPSYVDENTLFIASSFSGNTEEALSALTEAEQSGATIAIITGGGKLAEIAKKKGYPCAHLASDKIPQPRMAVLDGLKALVSIWEAVGLVEGRVVELDQAADKLKDVTKAWRPDVPTKDNPAKQLANDLMGRSMVIYGGTLTAPVAYKWKISFNENAKNVAWTNAYPEFNHNEFMGWVSHPVEKPYGVINLQYFRVGSQRNRGIEILKLRGMNHSKKIHPFEITNKGIKIDPDKPISL